MHSIIDTPKNSTEQDLLGLEKYAKALQKFIEYSNTPITIGIQGEWGTGKTSLMNTIRDSLCLQPEAHFHDVWVNTWEHSLFKPGEMVLISILEEILAQVSRISSKYKAQEALKAVKSIGTNIVKVATKISVGVVTAGGVDGQFVDDFLKEENKSIIQLREALAKAIQEVLEETKRKGFIFFIDDLDRLEPKVAVQVLEVVKNVFDIPQCIFVLAIDYGVIVKGLKDKYGVMTDENEREFRAFFDKIIQVPFSMPVSSYDLQLYLKDLLLTVNYFVDDEYNSDSIKANIIEIVNCTIGSNPRALKRLANSIFLIKILTEDKKLGTKEKFIQFILVCLQIAYPKIYEVLTRYPQFTDWDDAVVFEFSKGKKIEESELERIKHTKEFNDPWEQALYRICYPQSFLRENIFSISNVLNKLAQQFSEREKIGEGLIELLKTSAITSVTTDSKTPPIIDKILDWDQYEPTLRSVLSPQMLETLKQIHDHIQSHYSNNIKTKYTPNALTFQCKGKQLIQFSFTKDNNLLLVSLANGKIFKLNNPAQFNQEFKGVIDKCYQSIAQG
jgi:hypothetical protein